MPSRERFFTERIGDLVWNIPGLDFWKKYDLQRSITKKERQRVNDLTNEVLQKLQALSVGHSAETASGFRGPIIGFEETLTGKSGKRYLCLVVSDGQRLETKVTDIPEASGRIRKFRVFLGRFGIDGKNIADLSALGDKTFSWRRDSLDHDDPEKGLTLKESCQFAQEILNAYPKSQSPPQDQVLISN